MLLRQVKFANTNTMLIEDEKICFAYIENGKKAIEISFNKADEILELSNEEFFKVIFNLVKNNC